MRKLMFALCFAVAILLTGSWLDLSHAQKTGTVPAAAKQELLKAAKAHRVNIKADRIEYLDNQKVTIVRAPIIGIDKYSDADFEKGAPIELMIIKSKTKLKLPDGSYVVNVQYKLNPASGKTIFTDATGAVVAEWDRDWPVLTLPEPGIVGRDHGEAPEIDTCRVYEERFPRVITIGPPGPPHPSHVCAECACRHYRWRDAGSPADEPYVAEVNAFFRGLSEGRACMALKTSPCNPLPPTHP